VYPESINFIGKEIVVMSEMGMDSTIIQGDSTQRVVTFDSGESPHAMLVGFTIENGNGGILCANFSNPTIWQCKIRNNNAVEGNRTFFGGGGIACYSASPMILNSVIYSNQTSGWGGGILAEVSTFKLVNCVVYDNQASTPGVDGIFFHPLYGIPLILNSIIWNNAIFPPHTMFPWEMYYCDVAGGWIGEGNIGQDPQFVDPTAGNFHLQPPSPCINTGHPLVFLNDPNGTRNDMGAFGGNGFALESFRLDFGEVALQSGSMRPFHIHNLRDQSLSVSELTFSNDSVFFSPASLPMNIPAFSIQDIPVAFQPATMGPDSGDLSIRFSDAIHSDSITVHLKGEGVPLYGNEENRRIGILDAGLVRTLFINWGEVGHWPDPPSGEWPKGTGHQYLDGSAFIIQAETQDIYGNTIHPMETQYREFVDRGPNGELWGWLPLPGYFDPFSDIPAISSIPGSWPAQWPNRPPVWGGYWNGFFGRGLTLADQETYFVFDDSQDREWAFYPVAADTEDLLIWHYTIQNISDYDYEKVVLGIYIDAGIGGTDDSHDDLGAYLPGQKMVYFWDLDGIGTPGQWSPVGLLGFKYLEMPGNPYDGVDNDGDGLTDESRDNGIDDDGDWDPSTDDVGMDGVPGTNDPGENDGIPTLGEPNFDRTDYEESDDLTINTVRFFPVHTYELWNEEENWQVFTSGVTDSTSVVANLGTFIISEIFPLNSGETTYFSFAMIFGEDFNDLMINAGNIPTAIPQNTQKPALPVTIQLYQNYPNPFNPETTIEYYLPRGLAVKLEIYNILGQRIRTIMSGKKLPGLYQVQWDGRDDTGREVSSGVYIYRLKSGNFTQSRKMLLLR
jgi:hypothetical protein